MSEPTAAINNVIQIEGGYAEPPQVEQPTKYGVTQSDWSAYVNKEADNVKAGLPTNVQDLTQQQAFDYYLSEWWSAQPFAKINDQSLANYLFQTCVLAGLKEGIELLQGAYNLLVGAVLDLDGVLGPETLAQINVDGGVDISVIFTMRLLAARHYLSIVQANQAKAVYLEGWMDRALNK